MDDPVIHTGTLAAALGLDRQTFQVAQRAGVVPRPARGRTMLLAALRGLLDAQRAKALNDAPYQVPPVREQPPGTVRQMQIDAALDNLMRLFQAGLEPRPKPRGKPVARDLRVHQQSLAQERWALRLARGFRRNALSNAVLDAKT
ncbi:hypothetical protein [Neogemmobacter tilapiae]|uniref:Uncharacterized protein n=1 Tax=Neogemmobacter tilapiae TaxID=875041 RepID=A0A918TGQ3_9RHOB|nr:hypothetical protein [Gemmobacter tilapiae]GHC45594.1 hypothetical protein GCM10007315_03830 [Gemmobacter tilapiae]